MPLYMDIHKFGEISIDDVKKAHTADKSVQDRYGVKYHQFWVNEEAGFVFCLVEGPDKETCQLVHQTAHGNIACNIVEVEPGFYKLFMGDDQPVDHGLVQNDPGFRHIMVVDIRANTKVVQSEDYKNLFIPRKSKNLVLNRIVRFNGRVIEKLGDDSLVGIFNTAVNAVRCAKELRQEFLVRKKKFPDDLEYNISFRIGLDTGQPVTENAGFFKEALTRARRLCLVAKENEVIVSFTTTKTCSLENIYPLRSISKSEEDFIHQLFDFSERNLSNNNFNLDHLGRDMGVSRSQLYRKINSISGLSPNAFISSFRMTKALSLIKNNFGNISEIALEVGFQSPSYFTKCFQKNYGYNPSEILKLRDFA